MDPLSHTLLGAALAETGLKRAGRLATATLVIGANLPDADAVSYLMGSNTSLAIRRGWTHGIVAVALLPWVLAGAISLLDRWRSRHGGGEAQLRFSTALGLAYLAVLTHPALDWLNSYGVRLLMPFSGRWFYGDALFVVDPWFWLLAGSAVFLAYTRTRTGLFGTAMLVAAATTLLAISPQASRTALIVWLVGLAGLVALRGSRFGRTRVPLVAIASIATLVFYIAGMLTGARIARREADEWLAAHRVAVDDVAVLPVPVNPFVRDVIAVGRDEYYFIKVDWLSADRIGFSSAPIPRMTPDRVVRAAMMAPWAKGLLTWMRFPSYDVDQIGDYYRVVIRDVRFNRMHGPAIGTVVVEVDHDLHPRPWRRASRLRGD